MEKDEKTFFQRFEAIIWIASTALGVCAWGYTTFATVKYVDSKHDAVIEAIKDMHSTLERIDQRTFELARGNK